MLNGIKGKKVEIVFGAFDAVDGEVLDVDEQWLKIKKKNRLMLVQIDEVRRVMWSDE